MTIPAVILDVVVFLVIVTLIACLSAVNHPFVSLVAGCAVLTGVILNLHMEPLQVIMALRTIDNRPYLLFVHMAFGTLEITHSDI